MVESTEIDSYVQQLGDIEEESLKANLKALYDAGYVDFEENKIMIESNPEMSMEDIMVCIDESNKDEKSFKLRKKKLQSLWWKSLHN